METALGVVDKLVRLAYMLNISRCLVRHSTTLVQINVVECSCWGRRSSFSTGNVMLGWCALVWKQIHTQSSIFIPNLDIKWIDRKCFWWGTILKY